jgi:hypothetical protein
VNEDEEIVRSLGGVMCVCSPPGKIGPKGICPHCFTEGPFHRQALLEALASQHRTAPSLPDDQPLDRYRKIDWEIAFKEEPEDVVWLKPDFLEKGTLSGLFSKPGIGKSLLALDVSLEIIRNGGTVLIIDHENRVTDTVDRLRAYGAQPDELDRLAIYSFQSLPPLDTERGGEHLDALAEAEGADLIILDTVSRMLQGDENDASTYLGLYRCTLVRLKAKDRAVLRLDHSGKDSTKGQRGTSAKESDLDVLWYLSRNDRESVFTLECQKSRSGHIPYGTMVTLERMYEPLRHCWSVNITVSPDRYETVVRWMDNLGIATSLGKEAVQKILADNGVTVYQDQLTSAILARRNRENRRAAYAPRALPPGECPF